MQVRSPVVVVVAVVAVVTGATVAATIKTFIKRHTVERSSKAEIRPEKQS